MIYTNDQKLFCGDNGIGIVLLHGVTSGCAQMIPLGRILNDDGYTVHCVNTAGHGTYPQELLRTSWEDAIDKAWFDYDFMKSHFDKVYICGFSMGGCLALALASRRAGGILRSRCICTGIRPENKELRADTTSIMRILRRGCLKS